MRSKLWAESKNKREEKKNESEFRNKQRRETVEHSCLLLVQALHSVERALSAASLPKSSLTAEAWTQGSLGHFVLSSKGYTAKHLHTYISIDEEIKHTQT